MQQTLATLQVLLHQWNRHSKSLCSRWRKVMPLASKHYKASRTSCNKAFKLHNRMKEKRSYLNSLSLIVLIPNTMDGRLKQETRSRQMAMPWDQRWTNCDMSLQGSVAMPETCAWPLSEPRKKTKVGQPHSCSTTWPAPPAIPTGRRKH
jgi:hypothetical protein